MTDDPIAQAKLQAALFRSGPPNTRTATEQWLEEIGTPFTNVWLCVGGQLIDERHVKDDTTIQVTVKMSAERLKARTAAYAIDDE